MTIPLLHELLSYHRPAGSWAEQAFRSRFLPFAREDGGGNLWHDIGDNPSVLFSCHTDTVHRDAGITCPEGVSSGMLCAPPGANCLGADDGTGVWIMLHMIAARVPGRYAFHANEEACGVGSTWAIEHDPWRFQGITHAVAFDRAGQRDVITHQEGQRCASDACGWALAGELTRLMRLGRREAWRPAEGVFTDTAVYRPLVPECLNLSVGYEAQHTPRERQHVGFAARLADAACRLDWAALPVGRVPCDDPPTEVTPNWRHDGTYPLPPGWWR